MQFHIGGLISIGVGAYVLLAVYRVVRLSKNPEANEQWLERFGTLIKICGPILILYGLGELFGMFP